MGHFTGEAWLSQWPRLTRRLFGWVWAGKVFHGEQVLNIIFGQRRVLGTVRLERPDIVIDYPQLQLQDRLRPVTPWMYFGHMPLGRGMVYFTLLQQAS